jgi:hypothetical protein
MSKKSRKTAKAKRLREKRARRMKMQALYDSYREKGMNTKSKRARKSISKGKTLSAIPHTWKCGNTGCTKCFPVSFKSFLVNGEPKGMPQWMWLRWRKQAA